MNTQKKLIVTGATGYLGSQLVKHFVSAGITVACIVRSTSDVSVLGDVLSQITLIRHADQDDITQLINAVKAFGADAVIHLASCFIAEHRAEQIDALIRANVLFGTQLLEAMLHAGVKTLINTSTSWQHYHNNAYEPTCLYAATKEAYEKILEYYISAHDFSAITLEIYDTYGPDDKRGKLLSYLKKAIDESLVIDMSLGEQQLDLVHIEDVIHAYHVALQQLFSSDVSLNAKYAVKTNQPHSLREIAAFFESISQKSLTIHWGARPYRQREVMMPADIIDILPAWEHTITLKEGIKKVFFEGA